MKFMLYGDGENDPKQENIQKLCEELFGSGILLKLLEHMKEFEFEVGFRSLSCVFFVCAACSDCCFQARKDVAQIYNYVLRNQKPQAIEYVKAHPEILKMLVNG